MAERDESLAQPRGVPGRRAPRAPGAGRRPGGARRAAATALTSEVTAHGGRLHAIAQGLAALLETFQALHGETQGTLAALAPRRLPAGRAPAWSPCGARSARRARASPPDRRQARELMEAADAEWEHEFSESQASLDALDAQAADLAAESDHVFSELEARVAATDASLRQTVNEVAAAVDASADYLAHGLEPYLAAAFAALDGHVEREAHAVRGGRLRRPDPQPDALLRRVRRAHRVGHARTLDAGDRAAALDARHATRSSSASARSRSSIAAQRDGLDPLDEESDDEHPRHDARREIAPTCRRCCPSSPPPATSPSAYRS